MADKTTSVNRQNGGRGSRQAILALLAVFSLSVLSLAIVYKNFPELKESEKEVLKLPKNIDDAKLLGRVLSNYKTDHYYNVLFAVVFTYMFLQTFAIPGSIFLSIVSGFLFSFPLALLIVCSCSAVGATFCYMLSYLVGRPIANKYLSDRLKNWSLTIQKHQHHLLYYILFLRITPFIPNWFINLASPLVDVPITTFFLGTFFGVAPPSCFYISAGSNLYELTSERDAFSLKSVLFLVVSAVLALTPVLFKKKLSQKFE